jgi:signal transduction histidine kinase
MQINNPDEGFTIESLMEALFYRDEFLAIASHELKTPLTALKLHTQVFRRNTTKHKNSDPYPKEKVDRLVDEVDRQTIKLARLVNDMLDISRIRTGKLVMVKEQFSLTLLFKECLENHQDMFSREQVKCELDEDVWLFGDRSRIEQVIYNILNNAARYGNNKPIHVKLQQRKNKVILSVCDQGRGIKPEDHKRIFHRFQRAVPASEISGLGLGLYIAKEVVDSHEGKITVKSDLNQGATFKVEFRTEDA